MTLNEEQFRFIQDMTREHLIKHRCMAYTYSDGQGLLELAKRFKPRHILELGTALGYTACCLAAACDNDVGDNDVGDNCLVDTIEGDPEHVRIARENIAQVGLAGRIRVHEGDFIKVMNTLPDSYDIIFFDGLSPEPSLLLKLHKKLREGGALFCANLHFAGARAGEFLDDRSYWTPAGELEGGATRVLVKAV